MKLKLIPVIFLSLCVSLGARVYGSDLNQCPSELSAVCDIEGTVSEEIERRTGVPKDAVNETLAYFGAQTVVDAYAKEVMYRATPLIALLQTEQISEVIIKAKEACSGNIICVKNVETLIAAEAKKRISEQLQKAVDGIDASDIEVKVKEIVEDKFEISVDDKDELFRLAKVVKGRMNTGATFEEAVLAEAMEYGFNRLLESKEVNDLVGGVATIQVEAYKIIDKIKVAEDVSDDIQALGQTINDISSGQFGLVDGTQGIVGSINAVATGIEALGVDLGDDAKDAIVNINKVNTLMQIGSSLFTPAAVFTGNPLAVASAASQVVGLFSGGSVGLGGSKGPDPFIVGELKKIQKQIAVLDEKITIIDQKVDKILENQEKILAKLDDIKNHIAKIESIIVQGFSGLHVRLDKIEDTIHHETLAGLNHCLNISERMQNYVEKRHTKDKNKSIYYSTYYLKVVNDHYRELGTQYANSECDGPGVSPLCNFFIGHDVAKYCVAEASEIFSIGTCRVKNAFRKQRHFSDVSVPNDYEQKLLLLAQLFDIKKSKVFEEDDSAALLGTGLANKLIAEAVPSTNWRQLNSKFLREGNINIDDYLCEPDNSVKYKDLYKSMLYPLKADTVLYYINEIYKVIPLIADRKKNGVYASNTSDLVGVIDSMLYHLELLLIQSTITNGGLALRRSSELLATVLVKADERYRGLRQILIADSEEARLFKGNLGNHLLYNSMTYPYDGYKVLVKLCRADIMIDPSNEHFCRVLYDRLEMVCKDEKDGVCGDFKKQIVLYSQDQTRLALKVSFKPEADSGQWVAVEIVLPSFESTMIKNKDYVFNQKTSYIISLYTNLIRMRHYLIPEA